MPIYRLPITDYRLPLIGFALLLLLLIIGACTAEPDTPAADIPTLVPTLAIVTPTAPPVSPTPTPTPPPAAVTILAPEDGTTINFGETVELSITASDPTFSNVVLQAKKGCELTSYSSEMEEDSAAALGEILARLMARGMAKAEDQAGFLGDGTSTYWAFTGIAGALRAVDSTIGNIKSLQVASGNAYSEIVLPDFDAVVGAYQDQFDTQDTKWYVNRSFYWNVMRPLIGAYSADIPTIGLPFDVTAGKAREFLGFPVEYTNVMPKVAANSQICALLANLKDGAYLGERREMRIERSTEVYFTTDQIGVRATERFAINCFGVGDTTDSGPIMGLITAAA